MSNESRTSLREQFLNWIAEDSEDVTDMLSRFTDEERKAYLYQCRIVPGIARVDPNRIPDPPFPDDKMRRLLNSASEKFSDWLLERIIEGNPAGPFKHSN